MNTDELIAKLMELDPEGNKKIYIHIPYVYILVDKIFTDADGDIVLETSKY